MAKRKKQLAYNFGQILSNAETVAQFKATEKILQSVIATQIAVRTVRWGDEVFVLEMTQDCVPIGYVKVEKNGKVSKCNKIVKNKPITYYLEKSEWTLFQIKE